jgi:hypothetical protein
MEQVGSWVSYLVAVIFGLLVLGMNYWSVSEVLLIALVLVPIGIVVWLYLQPHRSK